MKLPNLNTGVTHNLTNMYTKTHRKKWAIVPSSARALNALRGMSTNFTCDSSTNLCDCTGWLDCWLMIVSGECEGTTVCGSNGCQCIWHANW
jgi:hypothetical protein